MKGVLYLSSVDVSLPNGPGVNEREFVEALQERFGERVFFVIPRPKGKCDFLAREQAYFCLPHSGFHPVLYLLFILHQLWQVGRVMWSRDVGLVVTRLSPVPLVAWIVVKLTGKPLAVKTLGRYWRAARAGRFKAQWPYRAMEALSLGVLRGAIAIDVPTREFFEHARRDLGDDGRLLWVENAVNTGRFFPDGVRGKLSGIDLSGCWPILGYAGGSPSTRGARQLVEVAAKLRPEYPQVAVLVVGEDSELRGMAESAARRFPDGKFFFPGLVAYEDVAKYVNEMDVCVSFDDVDRASTVGNSSQKVRQYLACGKPVVAIDVGNEFLTDHDLGSQVAANDIDAIAGACRFWAERMREQEESFAERAHRFAVENLSVKAALDTRVAHWRAMLVEAGIDASWIDGSEPGYREERAGSDA